MIINSYTRYKLLYLHWRLSDLMFKAILEESDKVMNVLNWRVLSIYIPYPH